MCCSTAAAIRSAFASTRKFKSIVVAVLWWLYCTSIGSVASRDCRTWILCICRVAILFILEIDDVLFAVWIPDATKVRIEKFRNSALDRGDYADDALLTTTKQAHTVLLSCAIMFPVLLVALLSLVASDYVKIGEVSSIATPFFAVYIGAALEARVIKQKMTNVLAGVVTGFVWIIFSMATQHLKKELFYGDVVGSDEAS